MFDVRVLALNVEGVAGGVLEKQKDLSREGTF